MTFSWQLIWNQLSHDFQLTIDMESAVLWDFISFVGILHMELLQFESIKSICIILLKKLKLARKLMKWAIYLFIYTIFQDGHILSSTASLPSVEGQFTMTW